MKKTNTKPEGEKIMALKKTVTAMKGETAHFIIGLLCVIFGVYLILAFCSFFVTGGYDQSILAHTDGNELAQTENGIQNYAGTRGAQLAQFLINDGFGLPAFLIIVFLIVSGMRLMKAYDFNLTRWFIGCAVAMIWTSVTLGFIFGGIFADSFVYPGGLHGYHISLWLQSQIGAPGLVLLLVVTAILFSLALSRKTMFVVRKTLHPTVRLNRKKKATAGTEPEKDLAGNGPDATPAAKEETAPAVTAETARP